MEEENEKQSFCDEEIVGEGHGRIDMAMERELHGKASLRAMISMIVGAVILAVYIVLSVFFGETVPPDLSFLFLIVGVIPFALGLIYTITYAKLRRNAACAAENRYRFGTARFYVQSYSAAGELIGKARYRYEAVVKLAKTERYLFLTVKTETQTGIFPILRESTGEETERFLEDRIRAAHPQTKEKTGHRGT